MNDSSCSFYHYEKLLIRALKQHLKTSAMDVDVLRSESNLWIQGHRIYLFPIGCFQKAVQENTEFFKIRLSPSPPLFSGSSQLKQANWLFNGHRVTFGCGGLR